MSRTHRRYLTIGAAGAGGGLLGLLYWFTIGCNST